MAEKRAKETPSVTKPLTSNVDARTIHPTKGTATYNTGYSTDHVFKDQGYKGVGKSAKTGKAEKPQRPGSDKADYAGNFTKDQGQKKGYDNVGGCSKQGCEDPRTRKNKKTSPWR